METLKIRLVKAGVQWIREFGYESVDTENILTDHVYSVFFQKFLKLLINEAPDKSKEITEIANELNIQL